MRKRVLDLDLTPRRALVDSFEAAAGTGTKGTEVEVEPLADAADASEVVKPRSIPLVERLDKPLESSPEN